MNGPVVLLCAATVMVPSAAFACSPSNMPCSVGDSRELSGAVPTDGVIPLGLHTTSGAGLADLSVEVADELGAAVGGTLEVVHHRHRERPWYSAGDTWLLVWRPDLALAPLTSYSLRAACAPPRAPGKASEATISFQSGEGSAAPVSPPTVTKAIWKVSSHATGEEKCCALPECRFEECGELWLCEECWQAMRTWWPEIHATVQLAPDGLPAHQQILVVTTPSGNQAPFFGSAVEPVEALGVVETDQPAPWCITIRAQSLVDQSWSPPVEACAGKGQVVPPAEPAPVPASCAADAGEGDTGAGQNDGSGKDSGTGESADGEPAPDGTGAGAGSEDGTGGDVRSPDAGDGEATPGKSGCATPGSGAPLPWSLLALFLGALARWRITGPAPLRAPREPRERPRDAAADHESGGAPSLSPGSESRIPSVV